MNRYLIVSYEQSEHPIQVTVQLVGEGSDFDLDELKALYDAGQPINLEVD